MNTSTILLVDDEPLIISGLRRMLHREPWHILEAHSGESALDTLARESVDVVISDEAMPGMPGSRFLAEVRRRYPATIRMMLSGQANLQTAVAAINEGEIYRFFLKPCREADILFGIREALKIHALEAERASLLQTIKAQSDLLKELEKENPGITQVDRETDGSILIDDDQDAM
jgi:two-component system, probable response regulator PhcQ